MTDDGGMNPDDPNLDDSKWDGPRVVLGRVAEVIRRHLAQQPPEHVTPEILQTEVENYYLLPDLTRETLESLSPDEQDAVTKVIQNLATDHFYIEGGPGALIFY
jgi:hypothetical protein